MQPSNLRTVAFDPNEFVSLEISGDNTIDRKKHVKYFNIALPTDKVEYELLLNNPSMRIIKDNFTYDKFGKPLITVWFEELELP
jgi:hypothetical protein